MITAEPTFQHLAPDQYISQFLPLDEHDALADFFASILTTRNRRLGCEPDAGVRALSRGDRAEHD